MILKEAYAIQMKLTSVILSKIDREERLSNEFAQRLQEKVLAYRQLQAGEEGFEFNLTPMKRQSAKYDISDLSNLSDDDNLLELEQTLTQLIQNQTTALQQSCECQREHATLY
mgnify:CR=1 FL=1